MMEQIKIPIKNRSLVRKSYTICVGGSLLCLQERSVKSDKHLLRYDGPWYIDLISTIEKEVVRKVGREK